MTPLPPAFERLATVLELSAPDFSLSFVTGPRDHVDSVYLRLVRALGDTYELVRHRVDRDGVNLRAALGGGSGERPRVVFVSGLEHMSDETRADATARLNLVRDSWGPYPAQVVFWLPSWGLAEFRRLAPDLFDWRSNLTVLHDADLPVRDEEEYLVWAAERHKSVGFVPKNDVLFAMFMSEKHVAFVGRGALERDIILRDAMVFFARARLLAGAADAAPSSSVDLDLLGPNRRDWAFRRPPVPVLLRATELAGVRDSEPGWGTVARTASIPGPDTAATVLSKRAEQADVILLLDGVDQLRRGDDTSSDRLLLWLAATPARLVAVTAGAPPLLPDWTVVSPEPPSFLADSLERFERIHAALELAQLLADLFDDPDDLISLAAHLFGPDFATEISTPSPDSRGTLAADFARACERHGLVDAAFFDELRRIRPALRPRIDAVARAYLRDP